MWPDGMQLAIYTQCTPLPLMLYMSSLGHFHLQIDVTSQQLSWKKNTKYYSELAKEFLKNLKPSYYDTLEIYFLHVRELDMQRFSKRKRSHDLKTSERQIGFL